MTGPMFPSTEGLKLSDKGDEYIYGGSVAINRILGSLQNHPEPKPRKLWLINCMTLLSNVFNKNLSMADIAELYTNEIRLLTLYIEAYANTYTPRIKPIIVFYIPDYRHIPTHLLRDNSNNNNGRIEEIYKKLKADLPLKDVNVNTQYSQSWFIIVGKNQLPHKEIS